MVLKDSHKNNNPFIYILHLIVLMAALSSYSPAQAGEETGVSSAPEADRPTLTRAINIDEASIVNSVYVVGSVDNDFSLGHQIVLSCEGIIRLERDWGLDLSFPQALLLDPLGQGSAALGPIGAGLRYCFAKFKNPNGNSAGVFSLEAQGFYWATPNSRFSGVGSDYVLTGLMGVRVGRFYVQGNYGYEGAFDQNFQPDWFAFSSLGYALGAHWALQVEADYTGAVIPDNGGIDSEWALVPQLGFKTDGWLIEVGESFNPSQAGTTSDFVLEKDFF